MLTSESFRTALLIALLIIFTASAITSATAYPTQQTESFIYEGNNQAQTWTKPEKGVVNKEINVEVNGPGGGGSGDGYQGGSGGFIEGNISTASRTQIEIYPAEAGGGSSNSGSGGWGRATGQTAPGDCGTSGGGGGMSAVVDPGTGNDLIVAGGGSGGEGEAGFLDGCTANAGAGANGTVGGAAPGGDEAGTSGNPGSGLTSSEVELINQIEGGGAPGGDTSGSDGSDGSILITYTPNEKPLIDTKKTFNGTNYPDLNNTNLFVDSDKLTLRSNVTDIDTLVEVQVTIRDSNGDIRLKNSSMSNISSTNLRNDSGTFEANYSFSERTSLGEWSYTIWAKDNHNLWSNSTGSFEVVDLTPPETRNPQQNRSLMTFKDSIRLEAEGRDNYELESAKLATNETGAWQNKTENYGSPIQLSSVDSWKTTSFNWKNESIKGNKSIHWRIWYNDSSGNTQSTQTKSFRARENYKYNRTKTEKFSFRFKKLRSDFKGGRSYAQKINADTNNSRKTAFSRLSKETITSAETSKRRQVIKPEQDESISADEKNPRGADNQRPIITGASFKAPGVRINDLTRVFSQAVEINLDEFSFYQGFRDQIESFEYQETLTSSQNIFRNNPISLSVADLNSRSSSLQRMFEENYNISDSPSRRIIADRLLTSSFNLNSAENRFLSNLRTISQNLNTTSPASYREFRGFRTVTDQIYNTDSNIRQLTNLREFIDNFYYTSDQDISSAINREFNQFTGFEDTSLRTALNSRSISESFESSSNIAREIISYRKLTESLGANSDLTQSGTLQRLLEDTYVQSIEEARIVAGSRTISQTYSSNIESLRELTQLRLENTAIDITDTQSLQTIIQRITTEEILQSSNTERSLVTSRLFERTLTLENTATRNSNVQRLVADTVTSQINQFRTLNSIRSIRESLSAESSAVRSLINARLLTQELEYQEDINRILDGERDIRSTILSRTSIQRQTLQERITNEIISSERTVSRTITNFRENSANIATTSSFSRAEDIARILSQSTGLEINSNRNLANSRSIMETIVGEGNVESQIFLERLEDLAMDYYENRQRTSSINRIENTNFETLTSELRSLTESRLLSENFQTNNVQNSASNLIRTDETTSYFTGSFTRAVAGNRIISDIISTGIERSRTESVQREYSLTANIGTTSSRALTNLRTQLETLNSESEITRATDIARLLQQQIVPEDQETFTSDLGRSISESLVPTTNSFRTISSNRIEIVTTSYSTTTSQISNLLRNEILQITSNQQTTRNTRINRLTEASLEIITAETGGFTGSRLISENIQSPESITSFSSLIRTQETSSVFLGIASRSISGDRIISEILPLDMQASRASNSARETNLETELSQSLSRTTLNLRDNIERIILESETTREAGVARIIQQQIVPEDQETITSTLARITKETFSPGITTERSTTLDRINTITTSYSTTTSQISNLLRNEILQITSNQQTTRNTRISRVIFDRVTSDTTEIRNILIQRVDQVGVESTVLNSQEVVNIRTVTEALVGEEAVNTGSNLGRLFASEINTAITGSRTVLDQRNVQNQITATSNTLTALDVYRTLSESYTSIDRNFYRTSVGRTIEQQLEFNENIDIQSYVSRLNTDTFSGSIASSTLLSLNRDESLGLSLEADTLSSNMLSRIKAENLMVQGVISTESNLDRAVTEILSGTDNLITESWNKRFQSLNLGANTATNRNSALQRIAPQGITGSFISSRAVTVDRLLNNDLSVEMPGYRNLLQDRTVDSVLSISDTNTEALQYGRVIRDAIIQNDQNFGSSFLGRTLVQTLNLGENTTSGSALNRITTESVGTSTSIFSFSNIFRTEETPISSRNSIITSSDLVRSFGQNIYSASKATQSVAFPRIVEDQISYSAEILSDNFIKTVVELGIEAGTSDSRQSSSYRLVSDLTGINEEIFTASNLKRELTPEIVSDITFNTQIFQTRDILTGLSVNEQSISTPRIIRSFEETWEISRSINLESALSRTIGETLEVNEEEIAFSNLARLTTEQINSEIVSQQTIAISRDVTTYLENTFSTDVVSDISRNRDISIQATSRIFSESLVNRNLVTDVDTTFNLARQALRPRTVEDIIRTTNAQQRTIVNIREVTQILQANSNIDRLERVNRLLTQEIENSILSQQSTNLNRLLSQDIGAENQFSRNLVTGRFLASSLQATPVEERSLALARFMESNIETEAITDQIVSAERTIMTGLDLASSEDSLSIYPRSLEEILRPKTSTETQSALRRALSQGLITEEQSLTQELLKRVTNEEIETESNMIQDLLAPRAINSNIGYGTGLSSGMTLQRLVIQNTGLVPEQSRSYSGARYIRTGISMGISESSRWGYEIFEAVVNTGIEFNQDNQRSISVLRGVTEELGLEWLLGIASPETDDEESSDEESSGSDGDGGFGGGIIDPVTGSPEISFTDERLTFKLSPGESASSEIELRNTGDAEAATNIEIERANSPTIDAINLQKYEYNIEPEGTIQPIIDITVPEFLADENLSGRVLERNIIATSGETSDVLPVNILVEGEEEELLDVRMNILDNTVTEGENIDYNFEIFNLGQSGRVDIRLYTTVTNSTGSVIHEEKEEIAVQTSTSVARKLDIDLAPGQYKLETEARYADKDASSFSTITVEEAEEDHSLRNIAVALGIVVLMVGSAIIAIIGYRRKRRTDYDKLIQRNVDEIKEYTKGHEINFRKLRKEEEKHKDRTELEEWAAKRAPSMQTEEEDEDKSSDSSNPHSQNEKEKDVPDNVCDVCGEEFENATGVRLHKQAMH